MLKYFFALLFVLTFTHKTQAEPSFWYKLFSKEVLDLDQMFTETFNLIPDICSYKNAKIALGESGIGPCLWKAFWKDKGKIDTEASITALLHSSQNPKKTIVVVIKWVPMQNQSLLKQIFKTSEAYRYSHMEVLFKTPLSINDTALAATVAQWPIDLSDLKIRKLTLHTEFIPSENLNEIPRAEKIIQEHLDNPWMKGTFNVELFNKSERFNLNFWTDKEFIFEPHISKIITRATYE